MTKPDGLLELVERKNLEWKADGTEFVLLDSDEWPRLRDSIVALREMVQNSYDYGWERDRAEKLLRRLDNPTPKEPGE